MTIGDVNSTARGSGARFNGDKVRLDYVPAAVLLDYYEPVRGQTEDDDSALEILFRIVRFEQRAVDSSGELKSALDSALRLPGAKIERWRDVCDVFDFGSQKYAAWNWARGMAWSVPLACIKRHCVKILEGEKLDDESGLSHFGHIGCNLVMLLHYLSNYAEGDDRPPSECFDRGEKSESKLCGINGEGPYLGDEYPEPSPRLVAAIKRLNEAEPGEAIPCEQDDFPLCAQAAKYNELPVPGPRSIDAATGRAPAMKAYRQAGLTPLPPVDHCLCSSCSKKREIFTNNLY